MTIKNQFNMSFLSLSENIGTARLAVASFAAHEDFTVNELEEIKVAVSEAISNCIIHGYGAQIGLIECTMILYEHKIEFVITDAGKGIEDIELARQPAYSTDPERMGLGFTFMDSFMDEFEVVSYQGKGTTVTMSKLIKFTHEH